MNGGVIGRRNVPGVDGVSGVWSLQEIADAQRKGVWPYSADTFDTNSIASYTQYADTAATWAISGGELVGTNGIQSILVRNCASYTDVAIEVDINQTSQEAGLALRFVDNNNYYFALLSDDSGQYPTGNIKIYKRMGGTFTQLGASIDITWPTGASKTVRLQALQTTLSVFVDGTMVLSVTDSSLAGPGTVGVRTHGSSGRQSKFQAFRWWPL